MPIREAKLELRVGGMHDPAKKQMVSTAMSSRNETKMEVVLDNPLMDYEKVDLEQAPTHIDTRSQAGEKVNDFEVDKDFLAKPGKKLVMKEVEYLLRAGLAKPSKSPWASPCLLVPNEDGSMRLCTDYRRVNSATVKDSCPLPRLDDLIDSVGQAKYVAKIDLLKGYYQGLEGVFAYLDDILVMGDSWEELMKLLNMLFDRLREAQLTINLQKCVFGQATVTYLGHIVGGDTCDTGAGGVLLQEIDGVLHPIGYTSSSFKPHQLSYSTIEKELLTPVIHVYTDHNPLTFLEHTKAHNQCLLRWALYLQNFNLQIKHLKGSDNVFADALSQAHSQPSQEV
ncbi:uncharacterized protein K02A2.6-like [Macrobrachium nipponense]|uniref:uncharacterized protein K02A2.6-like n=1 Tax=Macrobrachium nipponense TaxID=159736 RepID=UPI0030C87AF2